MGNNETINAGTWTSYGYNSNDVNVLRKVSSLRDRMRTAGT